jgi:hypothetical protein
LDKGKTSKRTRAEREAIGARHSVGVSKKALGQKATGARAEVAKRKAIAGAVGSGLAAGGAGFAAGRYGKKDD